MEEAWWNCGDTMGETKPDRIESPLSEKKMTPGLSVRFGVVSFLNDFSSEILTRSLPLFLSSGLGLSPIIIGLIEGIAETTTIIVTAVSGWLSDRMSTRKPLVTAGYFLSALARTLMFFTSIVPLLGAARVLDRIGKGFRTAPRDAMIADASHRRNVGYSFAVAKSMDTLGAVGGLSMAIFWGLGSDELSADLFFRMLMISVPFAWIALIVLMIWVPRIARQTTTSTHFSWHIPKEIRPLLLAITVFSLGSSSDAFLALRAKELNFDFGAILSLFIFYNIVASIVGWLSGQWSDKYGRRGFLLIGWLTYVACYVIMATTKNPHVFAFGFVAFGSFYGFTDGVEKALLSDLLPWRKRGLGYGAFQTILALVLVPANLLTGWLAAKFGLAHALLVSGIISMAGVFLLLLIYPTLHPSKIQII
jgi:MFS family permease